MKIVRKIIMGIITTLLILLFVFNVYNLINLKILKNKLSTIGGYAYLEVVSGSMNPTLEIGDLIVINTKDNNYQVNDIVTFIDVDESFVTHRIIEIKDDKIITKGDNNNTEDEATNISNIVGKYVFRIKGMGDILKSLKSPFVSVMIFIIGIMICYLISIKKDNIDTYQDDKDYQEFLKFRDKKDKNK